MKAVLNFIEPHGLVWVLLSVMLAVPLARRRWRAAVLPGMAWMLATLILCTPVPSWLLGTLERPWTPPDINALAPCDAVICLGGGAEPSGIEATGVRLKASSDRLFAAVEVVRRGKGAALVLGGGAYQVRGASASEADAVKAWMDAWKMTSVPVHSLGICADTRDEAVKTTALAKAQGWKTLALVTSASHMSRARATFEKAGLRVIPVASNYLSSFVVLDDVEWLHAPHVGGYLFFKNWMHEVIGTWVYRWRGWL